MNEKKTIIIGNKEEIMDKLYHPKDNDILEILTFLALVNPYKEVFPELKDLFYKGQNKNESLITAPKRIYIPEQICKRTEKRKEFKRSKHHKTMSRKKKRGY